jgi:alpha-glucosidase (family GH31 glycosyl hydrolase)
MTFTAVACSNGEGDGSWTVDAGALKLRVTESPWNMTFFDADGNEVLVEHGAMSSGPTGSVAMHIGTPPAGSGQQPSLPPLHDGEPSTPPERESGWIHAVAVESYRYEGESYVATLLTSDADRKIEITASPGGDGIIEIRARPTSSDGVQALGIGFVAVEEERFVGFGERSNAVDQAGWDLEHYVADGPYYDEAEYTIMGAVLPPWGTRWRPDTTYFPIPWLLSSRGYGVLIDNDEMSYHRLGTEATDAWSLEVEATELRFRVFGGPTPAQALSRYTEAVGRQPSDYAPWFFGPWLQTESDGQIEEFRLADVPTSLNATYLHYLPCGSQQGREEEQEARTAANHAMGVAIHTYFNPMICRSYEPAFSESEAQGALITRGSGQTYIYDYCSNLGSCFEVSQFDFASASGVSAYGALTDEALGHGYDGWMEDFGEYTPLDAISASGATGTELHNRYARDYHCGVYEATADAGRPLARFTRSGWTGSPACTPIVWGGDPTSGWDYDGLQSSIYRALSMGTSGVGIWGSDIGGFFQIARTLSGELFDRWIAYGGLSVIMRSQKNGVQVPEYDRPQPWDPEHQPVWRRYAKLHTQLYPYIQAAVEEYYETGRPIMQHHVLTHPGDPLATSRDDQYMFGPDILVAPVYVEGATERELYLPEGTWVEWWRSVAYGDGDGTFGIVAPVLREGGATLSVSAPLPEIPMFIEAGSVIPMLWPDVFTLAEYGEDPAIVHASDREDRLHVLAFPRGETSGSFYANEAWSSTEGQRVWSLVLNGNRSRAIHLEASMRTLEQPFDVCGVSLDGAAVPTQSWSYDASTGKLDVTYETTAGTLEVTGC